jgi:hypothetical protein
VCARLLLSSAIALQTWSSVSQYAYFREDKRADMMQIYHILNTAQKADSKIGLHPQALLGWKDWHRQKLPAQYCQISGHSNVFGKQEGE